MESRWRAQEQVIVLSTLRRISSKAGVVTTNARLFLIRLRPDAVSIREPALPRPTPARYYLVSPPESSRKSRQARRGRTPHAPCTPTPAHRPCSPYREWSRAVRSESPLPLLQTRVKSRGTQRSAASHKDQRDSPGIRIQNVPPYRQVSDLMRDHTRQLSLIRGIQDQCEVHVTEAAGERNSVRLGARYHLRRQWRS